MDAIEPTSSFGGVGRPVVGTVDLPLGVPDNVWIGIYCKTGRAMATFRSLLGLRSPELNFVVFPNHTFRADDVLPGTYELAIQVRTAPTPEHPRPEPLAEGIAQLVVPASPPCPNDIPLNLGEIKTNAAAK